MQLNEFGYGVGDNSYRAAGELAGVTKLVDTFYMHMDTLPVAAHIRKMHPKDLSASRQKLTYFLCGWLGGPKLYAQHYGGIRIPDFHKHFPIDHAEADAWLLCMQHAIATQTYADSFKAYLLEQLRVPAERIRLASLANSAQRKG